MSTKAFRRGGWSKLQAGEEGSALVELALSVPMLLVMLVGAAECARLAYASIEVTNAAHAAAIYASSSQFALADSGGISNAAAADSPNMAGSNAISVTSVVPSCTCTDTTYTPKSCTDNTTCQKHNAQMVTAVTVNTQSTFSPIISLPGWRPTFTLKGTSTQVVSNQ